MGFKLNRGGSEWFLCGGFVIVMVRHRFEVVVVNQLTLTRR